MADPHHGSPHALLAALTHPLRRRILRAMPDDPEAAISPRQIAAELDESLTHVSYHVRVLARTRAAKLVRTARIRGSTQHFYRRTVTATWAMEVLTEPDRDAPGDKP